MSLSLTTRQSQILDFIRHVLQETGFPPTRAEIATQFGFKSANAAEEHLRALAKKGAIILTAGASRGIRLAHMEHSDSESTQLASDPLEAPSFKSTVQEWLSLTLPIVGRVAAGQPILASEHVERELHVDPSLFTQTPDYLLKVKGHSMRDVGILEGDLLAVKRSSDARNGQIVVARIDDEVTVKRLSQHKDHISLLPENPDFEPIIVQADQQFAIEGLVVGLIRTQTLSS